MDVPFANFTELSPGLPGVPYARLGPVSADRFPYTDSWVDIRHAGDRIAATGMTVDMINDQFELLNEVSAVYDTP